MFKSAAQDIPGFYPEWVKKHPRLEAIPSLKDVKKHIPVADYRESVNVDLTSMFSISDKKEVALEKFCEKFIALLELFESFISTESLANQEDSEKYTPFLSFIPKLIANTNLENIKKRFNESDKISYILSIDSSIREHISVESPSGPSIKVLNIPAGTSLITASKMLISNYEKYVGNASMFHQLKDITQLTEFKQLSYFVSDKFKHDIAAKSKENFEIVFSTQPSDLLSMSIRSDWDSCQNLLSDKHKTHNFKAINSAISPNVGIIYLTNKKDYSGRGEEMVARALVFLLAHKDDGSKALNISKVYTNFDRMYIMDLFNNSLSKHSQLPVILSANDYYFESESEGNESYPYFDDMSMQVKNINQ